MQDETEDSKRLLTVSDVANWLSISGSLVYQLAESGKLPVIRLGNGRGAIRFQAEDVSLYIESCRSEKVPEAPRTTLPRLKHLKLK